MSRGKKPEQGKSSLEQVARGNRQKKQANCKGRGRREKGRPGTVYARQAK